MRKIIVSGTFIILVFLSCQKKSNDYNLPKREDINSIIKTVILDDSLGISRNFNSKTQITFCADLQKLEIVSWDIKKSKLPPKSLPNSKLIQDFIGFPDLPKKHFFFSQLDSSYLKFQNKNLSSFKLEKNIFEKINIASFTQLNQDVNAKEYFSFYYSTIPIVSLNGKRAFVQLTLVCSGLCGEGYDIFLEKINGKWKIVKFKRDWVS